MDAAVYMKEHANEFDVIIVDSSDPVGPAETLYTSSFYSDMKACLRAGGLVCTQVRFSLPPTRTIYSETGLMMACTS